MIFLQRQFFHLLHKSFDLVTVFMETKSVTSVMLLFYNILSDCHYSEVINSLLNAFRLKKKKIIPMLSRKAFETNSLK